MLHVFIRVHKPELGRWRGYLLNNLCTLIYDSNKFKFISHYLIFRLTLHPGWQLGTVRHRMLFWKPDPNCWQPTCPVTRNKMLVWLVGPRHGSNRINGAHFRGCKNQIYCTSRYTMMVKYGMCVLALAKLLDFWVRRFQKKKLKKCVCTRTHSWSETSASTQ